jgi:NAD(P)-dependent dehydrogenase (short-subunit alcohol dehydrogenase family)
MRSVVITGTSSGIGWGTAKVLVGKGIHVFGSVRKAEDAERLSKELGARFTPLLFDITDEAAVAAAAAQVRDRLAGETLFGLVNNAGIAVPGPLMYLTAAEYRHQLEVNMVGPFIVTNAFLPLLGTDRALTGKPGRIVNISSVGGRLAGPFIGPYHASKFGLEGYSDSLRRELLLQGVDVIVVEPGAVATPIWDKAEATDTSRFMQTEYAPFIPGYLRYSLASGRAGYPPERLGTAVWKALTAAHPRARYTVTRRRLTSFTIPLMLPQRFVDRAIARGLGFNRKGVDKRPEGTK